jgi:hypothetical protein
MALENSDLQAIKDFFGSEIKSVEERLLSVVESRIGDVPAGTPAVPAERAAQDRVAQVGAPDVAPDAGPEYYVHLADGSVVESYDSGSTHMPNAKGEPVAVIGRYQKGA